MVELGKDGEVSNVFGGVKFAGGDNTSYFDNGINGQNNVGDTINQGVYGKANHKLTCNLIKKAYPSYNCIAK